MAGGDRGPFGVDVPHLCRWSTNLQSMLERFGILRDLGVSHP
jgi:hypothetical protein